MSKHPEMMNNLMQNIVSDKNLIKHWHEMMQRNPSVMMKTMDDAVLRQQMIGLLLVHTDFMNTIRHDDPTSQH